MVRNNGPYEFAKRKRRSSRDDPYTESSWLWPMITWSTLDMNVVHDVDFRHVMESDVMNDRLLMAD